MFLYFLVCVVQLVIEGTTQFHHHANEIEIIRDFMQKDHICSPHLSQRKCLCRCVNNVESC